LDVQALQRFATSLQNDLSPKTIVNVLETIFAVLRYAKKSGMRTDMDTHRPVEMAALIGQVE